MAGGLQWYENDRWRDGRSVQECNLYMLNTGENSDVTFIVGPPEIQKEFKAHTYVLGSRSSVFSDMFFGPYRQNINQPIFRRNLNPDAFERMLWYVYFDNNKIDDNLVYEIADVAKEFNLVGLLEKCKETMTINIDVSNVLQMIEKFIDDERVREACIQHIYLHTEEVLGQPEFLKISQRALSRIMYDHKLNMSEEEVFEYVIRWAKEECTRIGKDANNGRCIRNVLGPAVIENIWFLNMSLSNFTKKITMNSTLNGLLSKQKMLEIFQVFGSNKVVAAQPEDPKRLIFMRFRNHKTGKGYKHGFQDAITFTVSKTVLMNYVLVYGSCDIDGGYKMEAKLVKGDDYNNEPIYISDGIQHMTVCTQKYYRVPVYPYVYPIEVEKQMKGNTRYTLFVKFEGPFSYQGSDGREEMSCHGTKINFFTNPAGRNGTTIKDGQFPGFICTNLEE